MTIMIVNIVLLVAMILLVFTMYMMVSSFRDLIVKFIAQNQEYYKNQKHLVQKSSDLAVDLKKVQTVQTNLKRVATRLEMANKRE